MTLTQITTIKEFKYWKEKSIEENKIFLIKFTASWCGPCRKLAPLVEEINSKQSNNIIVVEVNIDNATELCNLFKVKSIPLCVVSGYTLNANPEEKREKDVITGYNPEKLIIALKSRMPQPNN